MTYARRVAASAILSLLLVPTGHAAAAQIASPGDLAATIGARSVRLSWQAAGFPEGTEDRRLEVIRDGRAIAELPPTATAFSDVHVRPGERHSYLVRAEATRGQTALNTDSATVRLSLPAYLAGAATADVTPAGVVNLGGFGLGDGSVIPDAVVGRGGQAAAEGERIAARATVYDDGRQAIAIAVIENQGMFAAYDDGPYGLTDIAAQVAKDIPRLRADHILIATDHTHSGPDTIGAWGGPPPGYLKYVHDHAVVAIEQAYRTRRLADVRVGRSDASDLVYNQSCTEALNQSKQPDYTGPDVCATPGKDGRVRVVQATDGDDGVISTLMAFAAHATAGGGSGLHGDWPQFLADAMSARYGGVGIGMEGANGGTQPCRPSCAFTKPANPGYDVGDRKTAIVLNYMAHVQDALDHAAPVRGPVAAAQGHIREAIITPTVAALFLSGSRIGAHLLRSTKPPWMNATTVRTVTSALRVGGVLFAGAPGEGFPAIGDGVRAAVSDEQDVIQLGLANDQLGYLIAPLRYVPIIAAEAPVNDNIIFNVSPQIGDHVMCSDIALSLRLGFNGASPATCAPYDAQDLADPLGAVPVGGLGAEAAQAQRVGHD